MEGRFETRLFINNEYVNAKSGETITITNPADGSVVVEKVQVAGDADIDDAVAAASAAYKKWRKTPAAERMKYMNNLADLLDQNVGTLAPLETAAMGAPSWMAQFTASTMSTWYRYYAGWADKIVGESLTDENDGSFRIVRYEPIGVCAGIASWNATLLYLAWKIAPAVAAGNTFIFKASEKSPLGALKFGELVKEAGFPPGVINIVSGAGATGAALASHPKIQKISFTGSTFTGRKIQVAAANSNLKRVTLELGGKSAAIVFEDADMETVLTQMSQGFLLNSGQICVATTRMLVQESIADKVVEQLKARFAAFGQKLGDPSDPGTFLGPIVDDIQFKRVMGFLDKAQQEKLNVITGGAKHGDKGLFVEPTIILDPPTSSSLYKDEIFGPVLAIKTFKTEEEAVELANDTTYGLAAAVFTSSTPRALRVAGELEAGNVGVNMPVMPTAWTPFGGVKQSGYGREGGKQGLLAYLDSKTIEIAMK